MLIPRIGEKIEIANHIIPHIPTNISTYVNVFGGMSGIFFSLDFSKYKNVNFIYNDQNILNYILFKKLTDSEFINIVKNTKVNKEIYKKCFKDILIEKDEYKISLYWLIILCCSSTYQMDKPSWIGDSEFELFKLKHTAYLYHLNRIDKIHNLNYEEIIKIYDTKDTFFYISPPYWSKKNKYIKHSFTKDDKIKLANILNNIKGKFILSCYNFDDVEKLYNNCTISSIMTSIGSELLIKNYE
jgi:DNA adenine methylase